MGEEVTILLIKLVIAFVAHFENAVLDSEGVRIVFTEGALGNFDRPTAQVFAIEKGDPFRILRLSGENAEEK